MISIVVAGGIIWQDDHLLAALRRYYPVHYLSLIHI